MLEVRDSLGGQVLVEYRFWIVIFYQWVRYVAATGNVAANLQFWDKQFNESVCYGMVFRETYHLALS